MCVEVIRKYGEYYFGKKVCNVRNYKAFRYGNLIGYSDAFYGIIILGRHNLYTLVSSV